MKEKANGDEEISAQSWVRRIASAWVGSGES